jgi:predicted acetyltransferase
MILIKPGMRHFRQVMAADAAYEAADEEPYCGMRGRAGYASWLIMIGRQAKADVVKYGMNPNEIYLMMDGDELCGFGQLRVVETEDVITWAGHIGYSVPPDRRRRGYATEMLKLLLDMAYERGLNEVILTCDTDNLPSRRVIEKCGGAFEGYYRKAPYNKRVYLFRADGGRPEK